MAEVKDKSNDQHEKAGDWQSDDEQDPEKDPNRNLLHFTSEAITEEIYLANENMQNFLSKDYMLEAAEALKRLIEVCTFLNSENKKVNKTNEELLPKIADADEKLISSFQATASAQQTINRLKISLEESWREIDASRVREQDYQEEIIELQSKCKNFEQKSQDAGEEDLGPLTKHRGIILRERDRLNGEVRELEKRLQLQRYYGETLEQMCQKTDEKNRVYQRQIEVMELNENKSDRRIQMLMKNVEDLKDTNKFLLKKCEGYEKQIEDQIGIIKDKAKDIERLRSSLDKVKSSFKVYKKKLAQLKKNYQSCVQDRKLQGEKMQQLSRDNTAKDLELSIRSKNFKKLQGDFDNLSLKVFKLEKDVATLRSDVAKYKAQLNTKERDILNQTREIEEIQRLKELVSHERDNLRSELVKANNTIAELRHINIMRNITIDNLHLDIRKQQLKLEETKRIIVRVERERDEQIQEAELLNDRIDWYAEQVQLKADYIAELQRQLHDKHANLIKVQKLLETTNSERVMLQRSLQSCGEERSNLKNMQAMTIHQMAQLTEEISANQNKINQLHLQIDKLQKEKQEVLTELRSTKKLLSSTRQELKDMKAKNEKLQKTLAEDELRFMQLEHLLEDTTKEKNLIGLQMVRRNDEISLLKERLDIVQTAVDRGGVQYNQRIEDIRLLKLEIRLLNTQREVLKRGVAQTVRMRREIIRLRRNLDQKEVEVQALKADLRVPVNVHRWRILRGTDPERYSLVEKNRILQKRLLMSYIEGVQREKSLQNCHQLYVSLKFFIEKLPSYKVKEDFVSCQRVLRIREKKLKALTAELTAKEVEVQTRDCKIAELTTNLVTVKKELLVEKTVVSKLKAKKPIPLPPGKVCTA